MSALKEINIGLIGAGGNTKLRHIPGFQGIDGVKIVSVCNRSKDSSTKVAKEFGIEKVATNWQKVVDDPEVDAVCIGTWPYKHADISISALKAGKHVLTEARMAIDLKSAQAMLQASVICPDLVAQIVPSPFTLAYDETIREWIDEGRLGALKAIRVHHLHGGLLNPDLPMTWRQDFEVSGKNILTLGIYHEAVLRWLDAEAKVTAVSAQTWTKYRRHWDTGKVSEVGIPDTIQIMGKWTNGAVLDYHFSGVERSQPRNQIEIIGEIGSLLLDLSKDQLYHFDSHFPNGVQVEIDSSKRGSWAVEQEFIDSIRIGAPVLRTSFADGVRYMEFTEAVYGAWLASLR